MILDAIQRVRNGSAAARNHGRHQTVFLHHSPVRRPLEIKTLHAQARGVPALILETHSFTEDSSGDALFQLPFSSGGLRVLAECSGNAGCANQCWNKCSSRHVVYSINGLCTVD